MSNPTNSEDVQGAVTLNQSYNPEENQPAAVTQVMPGEENPHRNEAPLADDELNSVRNAVDLTQEQQQQVAAPKPLEADPRVASDEPVANVGEAEHAMAPANPPEAGQSNVSKEAPLNDAPTSPTKQSLQ